MGDTSSSSSSSGGIGFVGLLTILFITLKLLGKIDWSWWWVVSPLWIAPIVVIAILLIAAGGVGAVAGVALLVEGYNDRKRAKRRLEAARQRMINVTPEKSRKPSTLGGS